jgi:hypothetical protein
MHGDDGVAFIVLLEFEGDGDTVGEMEGGVIMTEEDSHLRRRICGLSHCNVTNHKKCIKENVSIIM